MSRPSLLSLVLLVATALVGMQIYQLWRESPQDSPHQAMSGKPASAAVEPEKVPEPARVGSVKEIVEKNLFDPERGVGSAMEAEGQTVAMQRLKDMVLLGTAILGDRRYAILQGPSGAEPSAPARPSGPPRMLRLKVGDTVEGFEVSEIHEKRVVFTKGSASVDIPLDFFRKVEETKPPTRAPIAPARPAPARRVPAPPVAGQPPGS